MNFEKPSSFFFIFFLIFFLNYSQTFYLPGLAPNHYCSELNSKNCLTDVKVFVDRLNSEDSVIPYDYYHYDFCSASQPDEGVPSENIGQILFGQRIKNSPFEIKFKKDEIFKILCSRFYDLSRMEDKKRLDSLMAAIKLNYQHNWIVDGLPITFCYTRLKEEIEESKYCVPSFPIGCFIEKNGKGKNGCHNMISRPQPKDFYLFNHFNFIISYHPKESDWGQNLPPDAARIVRAKIVLMSRKSPNSNENLLLSGNKVNITYSYSVKFEETREIKWSSRWDYILETDVNPKIQWFSILNSVAVSLLLTAMVAMVLLKTIKKDLANYNKNDIAKGLDNEEEDYGWKLIHGDVFRTPRFSLLLSVFVGNGFQISLMFFVTLFFACFGFLSPAKRGSMMTFSLVLYVLFGLVSGYISAKIYRTLGGEKWKSNILWSALLCPGIIFTVFFILNLVFWIVGSSGSIPFLTLLSILGLWFGISVPLNFIGAFFGFRVYPVEFPVRTNQIPRQIPSKGFLVDLLTSPLCGGLLPFGCISIQLFFILNSIWAHHIYYVFGFLFFIFIFFLLTSAETAILICYFKLCAEDYNWWWRSFLSSGSTSFYFFLYSAYYFFNNITDHLTLSGGILYFGYTFIMCFMLFLFSGAVGFSATFVFVKKIYSIIKTD